MPSIRAGLRRTALALAGLALASAASPVSAQQRAYMIWLDPGRIDVAKLIGLPPANNSPENRAEFEQVLQIANNRTPEREKEAIADQYRTITRFLDGIDHSYVENTHREMRLLMREANVELDILLRGVNRLTNRTRPFSMWNKVRIKPCPGARPDGTSFPAAHAATATLFETLLVEAAPERAEQLAQRVKDYSHSRLVCGFHFPSDLVAGEKVGREVAKALLADKAFRARYDETRGEIRLALGLK